MTDRWAWVGAPVLLLFSALLGHPLDLVFEPVELFVLGLATVVVTHVGLDGRSTWPEGMRLLALYAIAAIALCSPPVGKG
jgi:Ca2+:H+ antiporter